MTRDELADMVYAELPYRLRIAGRSVVGRIVDDAVSSWPSPVLRQCDAGQSQVVADALTHSMRRRRQQYGMGIVLTLILSALISEVVKIMLRWWLERSEHRMAIVEMQRR